MAGLPLSFPLGPDPQTLASNLAQAIAQVREYGVAASEAAGLEVSARAAAWRRIEGLQSQHTRRMGQVRDREVAQTAACWAGLARPISSAFASAASAMLRSAAGLRTGMADTAGAILGRFISAISQMAAQWAAGKLAMLAASTAAASEETTTTATAAAAGALAVKTAALSNISAKAAEGGAAAGASVAYWPYWGWAAAPGVAAETYGMLLSFSAGLAVPSAAGGWEVPRDTLAMVHEDEMILPASISDHIRDSMSAGGQDGGKVEQHDHWHISAVDAKSVEKFFMRNQGALGRTMRRMRRNAVLPDAS